MAPQIPHMALAVGAQQRLEVAGVLAGGEGALPLDLAEPLLGSACRCASTLH